MRNYISNNYLKTIRNIVTQKDQLKLQTGLFKWFTTLYNYYYNNLANGS